MIKKIAISAAAAAIMFASAVPSFASTTVTISHNGALSHNGVGVINTSYSKVKQTNNTFVGTFVASSTNTGGNSSSFNTGGTNSITTGGSTTTVSVGVEGGTNTNSASPCTCQTGDTTVDISNNGAGSSNGVFVVNSTSNVVKQSNNTIVGTAVLTQTDTGGNSSSFNTGGSSSITTGGSSTGVDVTVTGSSNSN